MSVVIVDVRLTDIREEPMYKGVLEKVERKLPGITEEMAAKAAEDAVREYLSRGNNETSVIAQKQQQVNAAVTKIAGLIVRRISATGVRVEKTFVGDVKRRINQKKKALFGSVDAATPDNLEKQYQWLRDLEKQILLEHALKGVPQWLR